MSGKKYTVDELEGKISLLISRRTSFEIISTSGQMTEICSKLEKAIEQQNLSCRIYTRNRSVVAGGMAWTGAGLLSLAAIAAHNLATFSPDYEIGKAVVDNKIYVDFKK
ncbi:hypothetical protein QTN94_07410 [Vibrio sp. M250220]|uniref:hypothetical protein n=1 Tax=Vibrio sp. M250220 TaxID=3020894 RepID=UPI002F40DD80